MHVSYPKYSWNRSTDTIDDVSNVFALLKSVKTLHLEGDFKIDYFPPAAHLKKLIELKLSAYVGNAFIGDLPKILKAVKSLKKLELKTPIKYIQEKAIAELLENNKKNLDMIIVGDNAVLKRVVEQTAHKIDKYNQIKYFLGEHEILWDIKQKTLNVEIRDTIKLDPSSFDAVAFEKIKIVRKEDLKIVAPLDNWMLLIEKSSSVVREVVIEGSPDKTVDTFINNISILENCASLVTLKLKIDLGKKNEGKYVFDTIFAKMASLTTKLPKCRKIIFLHNELYSNDLLSRKGGKDLCKTWKYKKRYGRLGCYNERSFIQRIFSPNKNDQKN